MSLIDYPAVNRTLKRIYLQKYYPMKDMKFKVHSPEHSKAIQERLFELGYEWSSGLLVCKNTNRGDLCVTTNGTIHYNPEHTEGKWDTLDDLYKMEKEEVIWACGTKYPSARYSVEFVEGKGIRVSNVFISKANILKIAERLRK